MEKRMRTISYYKNPTTHTHGQVFLDLELFFKALAIQEDVCIIVEPGDATHYELFIFNLGDTRLYAVPDKNWSMVTCHLGPWDLPDWNPYTVAVIADLANAERKHYDWEKSCPKA